MRLLERIRNKLSNTSVGFFVFDYNGMNTTYGEQAFSAIREALVPSFGNCSFYDGDVSSKLIYEIAKEAKVVFPYNDESPLMNPSRVVNFGAYLVAMWTDSSSNFDKIHSHLVTSQAAGYLGLMTLAGKHNYSSFVQAIKEQIGISRGLIFQDGVVLPETSKYGIH